MAKRRHRSGVVVLFCLHLALIAVIAVSLGAVAALDWVLASMVRRLTRAARRLGHEGRAAGPRTVALALSAKPHMRGELSATRQPEFPGETHLMRAITPSHEPEILDEDCAGISELISRSDNGVDVALLWKRDDKTAIVVVVDHVAGESFLLRVQETDNPLDIFHHPYAYAAQRDVDRCPAHGEHFRNAA
jgi:hypothetical protein